MIILFCALIFGIAVMVFLIASIIRSRKTGSKLVNVLKAIVAIESMVFIAIFVIVIIKTMAS